MEAAKPEAYPPGFEAGLSRIRRARRALILWLLGVVPVVLGGWALTGIDAVAVGLGLAWGIPVLWAGWRVGRIRCPRCNRRFHVSEAGWLRALDAGTPFCMNCSLPLHTPSQR